MNLKLGTAALAAVISLTAAAALGGPASAASQAPRADRCSLHVSIPHPHARQTEKLTAVTTAGGTTVRVRIAYKTVSHVWRLKTSASRRAAHSFGVGRPTKGYEVTLKGTVTAAPRGYRTGAACATSFTPR